ncbi:MAG TPA: vWA domain-containing protein [Thermoanaerobaculia bacterium]
MKRLAVAVCALWATSAFAAEAFLLNIPVRFNANQETGEVRVLLELSAAPSGTLVVDGTTLNLGQTATIAGDSVTFESAGTAAVRITYRALSNFAGDFCQGGAATAKSVPMRYTGVPNITAFRMSTYIVAAPTVECSKVSKRTNDTPATLVPNNDGVAPALVATFRGRLPLDVILVLDKSGSMNELPPGAAAGGDVPTKAALLKSALLNFVAAYAETDVATVDDRIGVVYFDSSATPQVLPDGDAPTGFFGRRSTGWTSVTDKINALTPGGATSIGDGINEAVEEWAADPANDLFLIVVTDGKQNTAPLVANAPSGFLALPAVGGLPSELRQRFIPIQTIGFGTPGALDEALLQQISLQTFGTSFLGVNASTMFDVFGLTLVSILKGNTLGIGLRAGDTMTGAGPTAQRPVIVDRSAKRVVFELQWAPPRVNALDLEVFVPGSSTPATPTARRYTPQGAFQIFDAKALPLGTWNVRVKRARSLSTEDVPYTLHALFSEAYLDYRITFDAIEPATGDAITMRAKVSYGGKPLDGLPAGAIKVRVQRPDEGLGTILAKTKTDGGSTTSTGDVLSAYDVKVGQLGDLGRVTPKDLVTLTLVDAKNGVYAGTFKDTIVPGQYGFEVVLDWTDTRTGRLRREERLELHVKVKPDPTATIITMATNTDGSVRVMATPRDRYGNYVGPGYNSRVRATLRSSGRITQTAVDPDLTGTYVFTVTGGGTTPVVDIAVDGVFVGSTGK